MTFIWFWISKYIAECLLLLLVVLIIFAIQILRTTKQARCSHLRVYETESCDAICCDCRKNVGFIGAWRESQKLKVQSTAPTDPAADTTD